MIIVIGAGPAGLALAYHLQKRGLPYRVLEKHDVGYAWRNHYDSLRLHTLKGMSALPGLPMPDDYPDFPTRQQVVDYLELYAAHFDLNITTQCGVERARRENGRWRLQTNEGEVAADVVVLATGIWSTPYCPHFAGEADFRGRILHANAYKNPRSFRNEYVLVVGAGNTGAELAVELSESGVKTGIVVRSGVNFVPYPRSAALMDAVAWFLRHAPPRLTNPLLRLVRPNFSDVGLPPHPDPPVEAFPVVGFELPEAVAAGKVIVYPQIERLQAHSVIFSDGRVAPYNTILLATGYRPTIDFLAPTPRLDSYGRIADPAQFPGLFTVGFHYPATEGWFQAIPRVAEQVAERVAAAHAAYKNGRSRAANGRG